MQAAFSGKHGQEEAREVAFFIHSHRRSGTHFLLDTVRQWFDVPEEFFALELLPDLNATSSREVDEGKRYWLVIDHEPFWAFKLSERHIWNSDRYLQRCTRLYMEGKHLYILRNPLDVLRSLYLFDKHGAEPKFAIDPNTSFRDFLLGGSLHEKAGGMNRVEYWANHVTSWCSDPRVLVIHYQNLKDSPESCLNDISAHFGIPLREVPRSVASSGVATSLTAESVSKGGAPSWDVDMVEIVRRTLSDFLEARPAPDVSACMALWFEGREIEAIQK